MLHIEAPEEKAAPVRMPFFVPVLDDIFGRWLVPTRRLDLALPRRDYLFPAVQKPRPKASALDAEARMAARPARSADVIGVLREILRMQPLGLSQAEASRITGHSLRHVLPTLARVFGMSLEDRNELGRWAAAVQASARRSSLPNHYSIEAEGARVLSILRTLLARMHTRVQGLPRRALSLPAFGGWDVMAGATVPAAVVAMDLEAEAPSSSDSESDGE